MSVSLALKTREAPGDKETEKEELGTLERGWDSWAMWNVSVCFCATIVLLLLECGEGVRILNKEPCRFQLSTCDQLLCTKRSFLWTPI